ncbi:MAG: hypothetical protein ACRD2B_17980 [Terriglobia bacterium]
MTRRSKSLKFVICVQNKGYEASLERRKVYRQLQDPPAERRHLRRIIDESGEDYLYPVDYFLPLNLPKPVEKALDIAS